MKRLKEILYLNPIELNGPEQMAIDLLLLEKSFTEKNFNIYDFRDKKTHFVIQFPKNNSKKRNRSLSKNP